MGDIMDALFILLLIFFSVLLYVVPTAIIIGVAAISIKWIIFKFKEIGDPHDVYPAQWECDVCGDNEDWHKHAP